MNGFQTDAGQFAMSHGSQNFNLGSKRLILSRDIRLRSWPNIGDSYGTHFQIVTEQKVDILNHIVSKDCVVASSRCCLSIGFQTNSTNYSSEIISPQCVGVTRVGALDHYVSEQCITCLSRSVFRGGTLLTATVVLRMSICQWLYCSGVHTLDSKSSLWEF